MNAGPKRAARPTLPAAVPPPGGTPARPFAWGQFAAITGVALAIFVIMRQLPTGTNLSHMDFRVDPRGTNVIEFCDPLNPQFIPVVAVRSPVTMTLTTGEPAVAGREVHALITLRTGSGKPVAPEDLLVTHTRQLHLLVIDPSLEDYQHVHPVPGRKPGEWAAGFTPRRSGVYRIFGDFTPAATGRGLYASVDLPVQAGAGEGGGGGAGVPAVAATMERNGYRFVLTTTPRPARAGQPIDLRFAILRPDGGPVPLGPVMGAYAHLVAFDEARSGFAHLHPVEPGVLQAPDPKTPVLNFKLTIPRAGRYTVWAQVNLGGEEVFVPHGLDVRE